MNAEKKYTLECCVDSVESAVNAQIGGATRFELCANLVVGGTSPGTALFREVRRHTDRRIHVLLRPRFGDFLYTDPEFSIIRQEVELFREEGADGVVVGCLTDSGELDLPRMEILVKAAGDMHVTLHRAFDVCRDPLVALRQAKDLGIGTILTSGQAAGCLEGRELIERLLEEAGRELEILIGAGVDASVIGTFLRETPLARSFHMSGKQTLGSGMRYRKQGVSMGLPSMSEYEIFRTDPEKIAAACRVLEEYGLKNACY